MRGVFGETLDIEVIIRFCEAFAFWLKHKETGPRGRRIRILVGRDTRPTGEIVEHAALACLTAVGVEVLNAGVCPTPVLVFAHKYYNCEGTIIVSASHNPPQYNGMKCLGPSGTFLSHEELAEIDEYFSGAKAVKYAAWNETGTVSTIRPTQNYINQLASVVNIDAMFTANRIRQIRVCVDPGAGAAVDVTDRILREFGFHVTVINEKLLEGNQFPRQIEPIKENLTQLAEQVVASIVTSGSLTIATVTDWP
jgi:phosphomannomutase